MKIYCEVCDAQKLMLIELAKDMTFIEQGIWGDILCADCRFVIVTISGDEAGRYELTKIKEG